MFESVLYRFKIDLKLFDSIIFQSIMFNVLFRLYVIVQEIIDLAKANLFTLFLIFFSQLFKINLHFNILLIILLHNYTIYFIYINKILLLYFFK